MRISAFSVLALLLIGLPAESSAEEDGRQVFREHSKQDCRSNLERIFKVIGRREHHSGGLAPFPSLNTLYLATADPYLFICPKDKKTKPGKAGAEVVQSSYAIPDEVANLLAKKTEASLVAIVFEKRGLHNGRRHVLFYDGSVELMDARQFNALKENGFVRLPPEKVIPSLPPELEGPPRPHAKPKRGQ
jgi:prepilin-type processing-associated H-X9-DG protein